MDWYWIVVLIVGVAAALVLLIAYICFRMAFYISDAEKEENRQRILPPGEIYVPYHGMMTRWHAQLQDIPCKKVQIRAHDGLLLQGRFYEYAPGAVVELMFHGYRGTAQRDLCGGVQRAYALGHSVLLVDQRASGESQGNVITFGILESKDCAQWVDFAVDMLGADARIILTGISMGAATVLMAAGEPLPEQVIGVLADCGYTSAKEIICTVIRGMGLPAGVIYPFVRLGAKVFGRFDPDADSPAEAVKRCTLPVIFFHGESDDFVPCHMSEENYVNCKGRKQLYTVPGAGHGLSYPADPEGYLQQMRQFFP